MTLTLIIWGNFMKDFLKNKTIGFYLSILSIVLSIILVVLYAIFGVDEFAKTYNPSIFVTLCISIVLMATSLFYEKVLFREGNLLLNLYAFIAYFGTQLNYVANLAANIDGSAISSIFIVSLILYVFDIASSIVSIIFSKKKEHDEINIYQTQE